MKEMTWKIVGLYPFRLEILNLDQPQGGPSIQQKMNAHNLWPQVFYEKSFSLLYFVCFQTNDLAVFIIQITCPVIH